MGFHLLYCAEFMRVQGVRNTFFAKPVTVISREYPSEWTEGSEPFYPVNDEANSALYLQYKALADAETNVIFGGRLGEYRYYDMHKVVRAALDAAEKEKRARA